MPSAMKRLSTIIRPGHAKDKSASQSSDPKEPESVPAPATTESNGATDPKPAPEQQPEPADPSKDETTTPVEQPSAAEPPAVTEAATDAPTTAVTNGDADKPAEQPAEGSGETPKEVNGEKEKTESKPEPKPESTKRDRSARDIGRDTIRRLSSILRAQKDAASKESAPPLPKADAAAIDAPAAPAPVEAATAEPPSAADAAAPTDKSITEVKPDVANPPTTPKSKKDTKDKKDKSTDEKEKSKRRSSFFQGLQRNRDKASSKAKEAKEKTKTEVVPKIVKKGAAKGKRVVVITGSSKGPGLEFVKQFAAQPNTFVIALSRNPDKSNELKSAVTASAKHDHNVRALRVDASSSKSVSTTVKDIVELTDGRIDLLINATETTMDPAIMMWDIKGNELEEELRHNLVGHIAITNALLAYLKLIEKEAEKEEVKAEQDKEKEEEAKVEATVEAPPVPEKQDEAVVEEKKDQTVPEAEAQPVDEAAAPVSADDKAETPAEPEASPEATKDGTAAADAPVVPVDVAAATQEKADTTDAAPAPAQETSEPAVAVAPSEPEPLLPSIPFVVFLAPRDPITNQNGAVYTGNTFVPAPRNLYSISRAALQVAIAKYGLGLGSRGVGVVGIERAGVDDPHAKVSEEDAIKGVLKLLPGLTLADNGKLLRSDV